MNQRGNQLYVAGAALLIVVLIVAGGFWYVGAQRAQAFADGQSAERGRWLAREHDELVAANAEILAAEERARKIGQQAAGELAALDAQHLEEMTRVQAERDRFLDDLASGRVRFHVGIAACKGAAGDGQAATPDAAGERHAEAHVSGALSRAVAGGDALAAEADALIIEAQGVIWAYIRACR